MTTVPFETALIAPVLSMERMPGFELVIVNGAVPFMTDRFIDVFSSIVAAAGTNHIFLFNKWSTAAKASTRQLQAVSMETLAPVVCKSARSCAPVRLVS